MLRITVFAPKNLFFKGRFSLGIICLLFLSFLSIVFSITLGPYDISNREILNYFLDLLGFDSQSITITQVAILETVRLPRILMAFVIGIIWLIPGIIFSKATNKKYKMRMKDRQIKKISRLYPD